ncbi:hypothetical protein Srot_0499 [Segniliparus rotundus DSM 44985]|uniref:Transmembrane protein n=1 Tax=Segniliparus rotundus (strain ATCC BAA-972 / CDC 1076 / CIP 108378 / DSM 44985 / JCM 13578) TaxID=640132 RepID=D6ZC07_SEGRD|nr:hypothetical protein [Segniliparus rotundus]ADG96984.1 hypothetical protein Srot_0499 [Segniliparus rotundus DSM 44985]
MVTEIDEEPFSDSATYGKPPWTLAGSSMRIRTCGISAVSMLFAVLLFGSGAKVLCTTGFVGFILVVPAVFFIMLAVRNFSQYKFLRKLQDSAPAGEEPYICSYIGFKWALMDVGLFAGALASAALLNWCFAKIGLVK